jgi:hypothetical protein
MAREPIRCQARRLVQRTGLLKQVCGSRDDGQVLFNPELSIGLPIQIDHDVIQAAND